VGSIAQSVAETLAGMVFAWLVNPEAKVIFGAKPMIVDRATDDTPRERFDIRLPRELMSARPASG